MPGPPDPSRYPWRDWPLARWVQYRADIASYLERDPKWRVGAQMLDLCDWHIERLTNAGEPPEGK